MAQQPSRNSASILSARTSKIRVLLFVSSMAVLVFACYLLFRPLSPEAIRDKTIRALENKDADTLCRLADPDELTRLRLTPQKVRTLLLETLWQQPDPQLSRYRLFADKPADRRAWLIEWRSEDKHHGLFGITVVDDPRVGWRLVLSDVLMGGYYWKHDGEGGDLMRQRFAQLDIPGYRSQEGDYRDFLLAAPVTNP